MRLLIVITFCLTFSACDDGLAPPPPLVPGFSGTVYFAPNAWPPSDSLLSLLIFASQIYPLDSAAVVAGLFQTPYTIFVYPSLSQSLPLSRADSISYSFPLPPGTYKYVGVIQQIHPDFLLRGIRVFRVVGFYKDMINLSQHGTVEVNDREQVRGINIFVDFQNPPPQPF